MDTAGKDQAAVIGACENPPTLRAPASAPADSPSSQGYYTYTATTNSLQRHLGALQSTIQTLQDDLYKAASVVQWQMGHPDDLKGFEGVRDVPAEWVAVTKEAGERALMQKEPGAGFSQR